MKWKKSGDLGQEGGGGGEVSAKFLGYKVQQSTINVILNYFLGCYIEISSCLIGIIVTLQFFTKMIMTYIL